MLARLAQTDMAMDGWMYGWMNGVFVDVWMDECECSCMCVYVREWMLVLMNVIGF